MPMIKKSVPAPELIGKKGYPLHYAAFGLPAPTKEIDVLVDDDGNEIEPETTSEGVVEKMVPAFA